VGAGGDFAPVAIGGVVALGIVAAGLLFLRCRQAEPFPAQSPVPGEEGPDSWLPPDPATVTSPPAPAVLEPANPLRWLVLPGLVLAVTAVFAVLGSSILKDFSKVEFPSPVVINPAGVSIPQSPWANFKFEPYQPPQFQMPPINFTPPPPPQIHIPPAAAHAPHAVDPPHPLTPADPYGE
jgi:hypothetical protein